MPTTSVSFVLAAKRGSDVDYSAGQIAAIYATYLMAASAKGVTGLGFSTICLPFLALAVGHKEALALVVIPSLCANVLVMVGAGRFVETMRRFWPMLLATVPGLAAGLWLLGRVDGVHAGSALGLVLIGFCGLSWLNPQLLLPARLERPFGVASGLFTGLVNGVTGSQVMPSLPYLMSLRLDRDVFVQAINCSFTLSSLIMAFGLARLGLLDMQAGAVSTIGVLFALGGLKAGESLRRRLPEAHFRRAVLVILVLMGIGLVARAL